VSYLLQVQPISWLILAADGWLIGLLAPLLDMRFNLSISNWKVQLLTTYIDGTAVGSAKGAFCANSSNITRTELGAGSRASLEIKPSLLCIYGTLT